MVDGNSVSYDLMLPRVFYICVWRAGHTAVQYGKSIYQPTATFLTSLGTDVTTSTFRMAQLQTPGTHQGSIRTFLPKLNRTKGEQPRSWGALWPTVHRKQKRHPLTWTLGGLEKLLAAKNDFKRKKWSSQSFKILPPLLIHAFFATATHLIRGFSEE